MSQRNPMNERYNDEKRTGKTRKSAASAKPRAERAATVRAPRQKTKKEKRAEQEKRQQREAEKRGDVSGLVYENTPEYKKLRRIWGACLGVAIVMVIVSVYATQNEAIGWLNIPTMIIGYALIIVAFYIDFRKIRKARREFYEKNSNTKEARAAQKKARAEAREQKKEAEEKFAAAKAEEEAKKENGFLARFRKKSSQESTPDSSSQEEGES